jgi:hypothetical protein
MRTSLITYYERIARAIDADEVAERLWQGSVPPTGDVLAKAGFTMVVLCAEEWQLPAEDFIGIEVVHAPNDDARELTAQQRRTAEDAAERVAAELERGGKVLVTCAAGLNRSGLVNGLALVRRAGSKPDADAIVRKIQERRESALFNDYFVELIHGAAKAARSAARAGATRRRRAATSTK